MPVFLIRGLCRGFNQGEFWDEKWHNQLNFRLKSKQCKPKISFFKGHRCILARESLKASYLWVLCRHFQCFHTYAVVLYNVLYYKKWYTVFLDHQLFTQNQIFLLFFLFFFNLLPFKKKMGDTVELLYISVLTWTLKSIHTCPLCCWCAANISVGVYYHFVLLALQGPSPEPENTASLCTRAYFLNLKHSNQVMLKGGWPVIRYRSPFLQKVQLFTFSCHDNKSHSYRFWIGPLVVHTGTYCTVSATSGFYFLYIVIGVYEIHLDQWCMWGHGQNVTCSR